MKRMLLDRWPEHARGPLETLLERAASLNERPYAVFDADNTLWEHDLEEALVSFLEARGRVSIDSLPAAIRPVDPIPGESLFGYYDRLCGLDIHVGYLWVLQVFCGFSLAEMKSAIDEMMEENRPATVSVMKGGELVPRVVEPPKVFASQRQLICGLEQAGVEVWVVSAASEDLCRMLVSDPRRGLGVAPENVVGANLLLRRPDGTVTTSAAARQAGLVGLEGFWSAERMALTLTHHLRTPATWYEGKVAGIKMWIDPLIKPILVAGDAASDHAMLFYCDGGAGGVRVRVDKNPKYREMWLSERERRTQAGGIDHPNRGWIEVNQRELGEYDHGI